MENRNTQTITYQSNLESFVNFDHDDELPVQVPKRHRRKLWIGARRPDAYRTQPHISKVLAKILRPFARQHVWRIATERRAIDGEVRTANIPIATECQAELLPGRHIGQCQVGVKVFVPAPPMFQHRRPHAALCGALRQPLELAGGGDARIAMIRNLVERLRERGRYRH